MTNESCPYQLEPIHQCVGDEKQSALEMLNLVSSSLERAWMSSDKKKEKLAQIEALRIQIHAVDDCKLNMMMENSASSKCVPGMGFFSQRSVRKEITQQLATALKVLQLQNTSIRSDECTAGDNNEIMLMDGLSIADDESTMQSEADTNVSIGPDVKALNDEDTDPLNTSFGSSESGISDGSDDVVVTTSCLTSEATGPLGVSITTWHRKKLANESTLGEYEKESEEGESTDEENLEAKENVKYNKSLEEISVSFGPSLTIRATTRTKSVRFANLKPTTEDNIQRARELLKNANRAKMKRDSMCKFQPIEENKTEE